jgi:hypothetical protein
MQNALLFVMEPRKRASNIIFDYRLFMVQKFCCSGSCTMVPTSPARLRLIACSVGPYVERSLSCILTHVARIRNSELNAVVLIVFNPYDNEL